MKRLCALFIALLVLAMAVPALATLTRVETMGEQHLFIVDDYNVWTWTSTVNNYPRHLIVDHNGAYRHGFPDSVSSLSSGSRVGMIIPFLQSQVVGVFVSDGRIGIPIAPANIPDFPGGFRAGNADQRLDLFWGYRGASFDLGVHLNWWGDKLEQVGEISTSSIGIQVGAGINASGNMLELNGFYQTLGFTNDTLVPTPPNTTTGPVTEKDAGAWMGLRARYLYAYNNMVTLIPMFDWQTFKISEKDVTTSAVATGEEIKGNSFDLGVGCNTVPLQGTEFLTSVGYMNQSWKYSNDTDQTSVVPVEDVSVGSFYLKAGADIQLKNWLYMRVGANKYILSSVNSKLPANATWKSTHSDLEYRIGAGIMVGDVQFDVQVRNSWLNNGPYFLSGQNGGNMFPYISFKYDFR